MRLRNNKTKYIHDDVFRHMTGLRDLHLEQNFIEQLPESFTCLTTLILLHLSANRLRELPNVSVGAVQMAKHGVSNAGDWSRSVGNRCVRC